MWDNIEVSIFLGLKKYRIQHVFEIKIIKFDTYVKSKIKTLVQIICYS